MLSELLAEVAVTSVGGAVIGFAAGYAVFSVMRELDEHMTEIVLTLVLAYGSFILAEHSISVGGIHFSGVIATVVAGLFIGNRGADHAMSPRTRLSVFNTWETAAFIVNTFIFVVIGVTTPLGEIISRWELLLPAIVLVVVARAVAVYPLSAIANRVVPHPVSLSYQHVLVWGGLHASIPIALVLGLPPSTPLRAQLRAMVFGVAAFSLVVQGLTMSNLLDRLGIVTRSDAEELFELLLGRARAVDAGRNRGTPPERRRSTGCLRRFRRRVRAGAGTAQRGHRYAGAREPSAPTRAGAGRRTADSPAREERDAGRNAQRRRLGRRRGRTRRGAERQARQGQKRPADGLGGRRGVRGVLAATGGRIRAGRGRRRRPLIR